MQFKPALAGGTVSTCVTNIINIKHQAQLYQGDKHYFRSGFTLSIPVFHGLVSFFFCGFFFFFFAMTLLGFPGSLEGKASACSVRDLGSVPGLGRSPGEGNGNPLQYSCLEIPWMEEPGRLQSMGLKRVGHDWATSLSFHFNDSLLIFFVFVFHSSYSFCRQEHGKRHDWELASLCWDQVKSPGSACGFGQQAPSSGCYVEFSIKVREDGLLFFRVCKLSDSVDVIRYLQLLSFSNLSQLLAAAPISLPLFTVRKSWRMLISPSSAHHSTHSQCIYTPSTKQPSWWCPSLVCHSRRQIPGTLCLTSQHQGHLWWLTHS